MTDARKQRKQFATVSYVTAGESKGAFSHTVSRVKKQPQRNANLSARETLPKKYQNIWYLKQEAKKEIAQQEVLAQEFFRLFIPGHPKTRLVIDGNNNTYVASKEIPNFQSLPYEHVLKSDAALRKKWNEDIRDGTITGLGEIVTIALLLNEADLKLGNMAFNEHRQLIKFDGDWCFAAAGNRYESCDITEDQLNSLPFPGSYNPYNWLGAVSRGIRQSSCCLDADIAFHSRFRAEIHHALLKVLVLPDSLLQNFIQTYIPDAAHTHSLTLEFSKRRNQLRHAALHNDAFLTYLTSPAARKDCQQYIEYLSTFKTTHKNFILQTISAPEKQILDQLDHLLSSIPQKKCHRTHASPPHRVPQDSSFSLFIRSGVFTGFASGLFIAAIFIALRILDILTFGLSIPVSICANILVCSSLGALLGHSISKKKNPLTTPNSPQHIKKEEFQQAVRHRSALLPALKEKIESLEPSDAPTKNTPETSRKSPAPPSLRHLGFMAEKKLREVKGLADNPLACQTSTLLVK